MSAAERSPDAADSPEKKSKWYDWTLKLLDISERLPVRRGFYSFISLLVYVYTAKLTLDYVFDGRNPPYYPNSKPKYFTLFGWKCWNSPLNFYGETKLKGEQAALSANPTSAITLRVPILYSHWLSILMLATVRVRVTNQQSTSLLTALW